MHFSKPTKPNQPNISTRFIIKKIYRSPFALAHRAQTFRSMKAEIGSPCPKKKDSMPAPSIVKTSSW
jgi:hypothetical protein